MKWSRTHTLVAGLALILATNTVALVGVAYNRSGEPESTLKLTQRELRLPHRWGFEDENSGLTLSLMWRMLGDEVAGAYGSGVSHPGSGGSPYWLDKAKLATLGFDVSPPEDSPDDQLHYSKALPKEALLVLELDGPAYQAALERARRHRQKAVALLTANPGNKEFENRANRAREQVAHEEQDYSRLFIVDAGLDVSSLRARYPDRARYAIVRGQVQPRVISNKNQRRVLGYINHLRINEINLPLSHQEAFKSKELRVRTRKLEPPLHHAGYEVVVAFGKRLEPWIIEATALK
jgi:hypothetical protein